MRNFDFIGSVKIKNNGCCKDKPVLIADNHNGTYGCECECGIWCSQAMETIGQAIDEYINMCERADHRRYELEGE